MVLVSKVICTCYLGVLAIADIRKKSLPVWLLGTGVMLALTYQLIEKKMPIVLWLSGAAVGIVFLIVSKTTGEALGYGDGVLIGILGIYLGLWELMCLLMTAFFLTALYAAVILMRCKFRRKTSFPFVPFLGTAYMIVMAAGR